MLNGIHPLLHADLLHALASMGHGDELVIADANFPAASLARRLVFLAGVSSADALDAVLTVFPLDDTAAQPAFTMEAAGDPAAVPDPVRDFAAVFTRHQLGDTDIGHLDREAFCERARKAFVIVRTGELRPCGSILLVKGVIRA